MESLNSIEKLCTIVYFSNISRIDLNIKPVNVNHRSPFNYVFERSIRKEMLNQEYRLRNFILIMS
jgi:hypothetical protein